MENLYLGDNRAAVKLKFYATVALLYAVTIYFGFFIARPMLFLKNVAANTSQSQAPVVSVPLAPNEKPVIQGRPSRIVIIEKGNGLNIDLPVKDGNYDEASGTWNISEDSAHYATPSLYANDKQGVTLIYGHNNNRIFGLVSAIHENAGSYAEVYTDNGYKFKYMYVGGKDVLPEDTSVFSKEGLPRLIVQSCSGDFQQYRILYEFKFESVQKL